MSDAIRQVVGSRHACWRAVLLAVLTAVLALLLAAPAASAVTLSAAETRVGTFHPAVTVAVGVHECVTAGQRPVRGPSQPQLAAGSFVAAEGAGATSQVLLRSQHSLQAKYKHAADFGVTGNYNKANAAEFSAAIHKHINASGTRAIQGTYHGEGVTHYLDPSTGLNVISRGGEFVSGWQLNSTQLWHVLKHGGLGGG